ncbi:MAG TPA: FeoA domain-containing protein, partial [Fibrobacteraceae bacterium]|nr:FeoA domain-containing protein [Fibrobacteraceae bacterium]
MKPGDQAEIIGYQGGDQRYKSKLLAMGLVRGVVL